MKTDLIIIFAIFSFLLFAAIRNICEDYGFNGTFTSNRKESSILKGTYLEENDTCESVLDKLRKVLSVNSRTTIWKTCFITSIFITIVIYIIYNRSIKNDNKIYFYILTFWFTYFILYYLRNFELFHKDKNNQENGDKIVDFINKNCIKK